AQKPEHDEFVKPNTAPKRPIGLRNNRHREAQTTLTMGQESRCRGDSKHPEDTDRSTRLFAAEKPRRKCLLDTKWGLICHLDSRSQLGMHFVEKMCCQVDSNNLENKQ